MNNAESVTNRLFIVFGLTLLIPCALVLQLLRVNFLEGDELRELWNEQAIDFISIPAQRGNIYDDSGSLLATNSVAYKVAVDPHMPGITRAQLRTVADTLGRYTGAGGGAYLRRIDSAPRRSRYVVLDESISSAAYEALRALDIRGVILEEEYERRYSFGSLAAHVLGFTNHGMEGMIGLEKQYDDRLEGTDGVQQVRRDRNGRIFAYLGAPRRQPRQGQSLHTTIDAHIQAILEEELRAGIDRTGSDHGSAIIMDPRTGAIKAMANYPTFDPNNPASTSDENRRNFAISDMVEPGSTFKLVTAVAAVEQDKVSFDETFETPEDGTELIHGQMMRDHDPLGTLTFPEVIQKSSNVATSRIARRLSKDTFYQYARNMGFGTPTNIDLPGEADGRLQKPYEWSLVTLPWMSIGYEVQATPIQITQAYAAFANGGNMMRPYLVDKITEEDGSTTWKHEPVRVRRIASRSTIEKLQPVFADVVSDSGTADQAQVQGLAIGGKTGTAQKYIDGRYRTSYRASFVGYFPADNPRYVVLVMLDEPKTSIYGGWTAGPIFSQTAKRIAGLDDEIERQIMGADTLARPWAYAPEVRSMELRQARALLDNQEVGYRTQGSGNWVSAQTPPPGTELESGQQLTLTLTNARVATDTTEVPENYSIIPDVGGMSMRKASLLITRAGFEARLIGSGTVYTQFPRPGDMMEKGREVTVRGKARSLQSLTDTQEQK
ncbi:MAG: penicillin-binding transpeptidase domain-containing protein [Balneolaceae bacterium]|nr:penicillin-binding transpeptidase domain-containing protein [Balneolaceae bacterium]